MNAGPDVERLISSWLVEEAPGRAPDRILDAAGRVIDRTNQRRFVAAWREPMYVTLRGLVAAGVVAAVVIGGAMFAFKGAPSTDVGASPTPSASAVASPDAATLLSEYRVAYSAICEAARAAPPVPNADLWDFEVLYDPDMSAADRALSLAAGSAIADRIDAMADDIEALAPPPQIAAGHVAMITRTRDIVSLIRQEVELLRAGKLAEGKALDEATGPLSGEIAEFERTYALTSCP